MTREDGPAPVAAGVQDRALAARTRRAERWWLRNGARPLTSLARLRACGRTTVTGLGGPSMRHTAEKGAGYAGLSTCSSPWACPLCAGKIAAKRAADLVAVMTMVRLMGGSAFLVTFTVRHHKAHRLAELWDAVSAGWGAVTSGRQWHADAADLFGWCRVVEATHTPSAGWHLHVHSLWCWPGQVDEVKAQEIALRAWMRWNAALGRHGFDSTPVRGVDARRVRFADDGSDDGLGAYFTKIAAEIAASYAKDSRSGRSPFATLRDAVGTYRVEDIELWNEWERASHARRQLTWSTGRRDLRRMAGVREQTNEEIAEETVGDDDVIQLSADAWEHLCDTGQQAVLLDLAETEGMGAVTAWLDARGLAWAPARPAPRRERRSDMSPDQRRQARSVLGP